MDRGAREAWQLARPGRDHAVDAVCVAPWVSLELDPSGWVYGCCANQLYPLGRIGEQRLSELWDGPRARVLKDALRRWDLSVGCGSCRWHLEHGRMDPDAAVYDRYPVQSERPEGPVAMTFALSNRCNLGCVMCTPELSSTLRHQAGLPALASPYDDAFYDDLVAFLPGLSYAKFLGGEPFLIPEHHRVWDLMDAVGGPPRMQVTTNGTVWSERIEWLLQRFAFDITVSIDAATASVYEAIRRGARFDAVSANVDRFATACREAGTELRFCFCLMPQNAEELAGMVRWADGLGAALSVNVVTDVGLALHDLPTEQLDAIRIRWRAQEAEGPFGLNAEVWQTQLDQLDAVIDERRRGVPIPARQAQPATEGFVRPPRADPDAEAWSIVDGPLGAVDVERDRLTAWSGGGPVADLRVGPHGVVVAVASGHDRLGIGPALIGSPVMAVISAMEVADGRPAWVLGLDDASAGTTVHTVILAATHPERGTAGAVVRMVAIPAADGFALLVAEDRIYDAEHSVPVAAPRARS